MFCLVFNSIPELKMNEQFASLLSSRHVSSKQAPFFASESPFQLLVLLSNLLLLLQLLEVLLRL